MKTLLFIRTLFIVAALYDGILGVVFLLAGPAVFRWFAVTPPNHWGYIQFPAALLLIFAIMFAMIAAAPVANRNLIPYGMLVKLSYSGLTFYHWAMAGVPTMWKPFAVIDVIFLALFAWSYLRLRATRDSQNTGAAINHASA